MSDRGDSDMPRLVIVLLIALLVCCVMMSFALARMSLAITNECEHCGRHINTPQSDRQQSQANVGSRGDDSFQTHPSPAISINPQISWRCIHLIGMIDVSRVLLGGGGVRVTRECDMIPHAKEKVDPSIFVTHSASSG